MTTKYIGLRLACAALLAPVSTNQSLACGDGVGSIVSVPTLGGTGFQVNAANRNAQLTGFSYLPGDQSADAFFYSGGATVDLGTLGAGVSIGYAINNLGQVVGQSDVPSGETHAFFYDGTTMNDLGTLGGVLSSATAINDAGQVAGTSLTADWQNMAFLYSDGQMIPLGDFGGGASQANAINQHGTVVGMAYTAAFSYHGFIYQNGTMTDLGDLGSGYSWATAVNNSDMVVGDSSLTNWDNHAFLYSNGVMTDLGTLGGSYSTARGINDAGQVIGTSLTAGDAERHGFIYSNGLMTDLGALDGAGSDPAAINNQGQVVGYYLNASGVARAFLWKDGQMQDLNSLLPADSNWELQDAVFITDAGQIVGYGTHNGAFEWYVFNPATANNDPVSVAGADQTVECHTDVTLDGSGSSDPDGDALTYEWSVGGNVIGTAMQISPVLPLGDNVVTLKVSDPCGGNAQSSLTVHVVDTTAPTGGCPADTSAAADANGVAPTPDFTVLVQASDNCTPAGSLHVTQTPSAGTMVGLGAHPVSILVADESGNHSGCQVTFAVVDQTAPVITALPPAQHIAAGTGCRGTVPDLRSAVKATDNCTPAGGLVVTQSPAPGASLSRGDYVVTFQVTDGSGNSCSANVPLTVEGTPPVISSVTASPDTLSPPNHQMVPVTISVATSGGCDSGITARIVAVSCNETLSAGEYEITGDLTLNVAASRDGSGNGRVYTVQVQCRDGSGNTSTGYAQIVVPKGNSTGGGTTNTKPLRKAK